MKTKLWGIFILTIMSMLYITACDNSTSPGIEDSLELFAGLEKIPEASNTTVTVNKGTDLTGDGYFSISINGAESNPFIQNETVTAWCLEWKKPLRSNNDDHKGVKWYDTSSNEKWKPLNYFLSIRRDLQKEDTDLTYREIQAVIWSIAGYMNIAPEFNVDELADNELPSRLRTNGVANFSKDKVREIVKRVLTNYSNSSIPFHGVVAQTEEDQQDVIADPDPDPEPGAEVARIDLEPDPTTVKVSEEIQMIATFYDAEGSEVTCESPEWSTADESIAIVNSDGLVSGLNQGETTVIVECDEVTDTATVIVEREDIQTPGRDVIVFNDVEPFDETRLQNPNNVIFIKNLINFTTNGPRNDGDTVMWDCGRNTRFNGCISSRHINGALKLIEEEGFNFSAINSTSGTLVDIPKNVKSLWLWLPTVSYTVEEINALKQFAAEGGRIVFIGEWDGFYGAQGLAVENQLLINLGAVMRNVGNAVDCGNVTLPEASIREHPITEGVTNLTIGCASVIELGPDDFPLFYDTTNTLVLAGVAKIDTVPITELQNTVAKQALRLQQSSLPNPASTTGY